MRAPMTAAVAAMLLTSAAYANEDLMKFEKQGGLPDFQFEAKKPEILLGAPPSAAAEAAMVTFDRREHPRMIGGRPVNDVEAETPWQVGLIFASAQEPARVQFCGGSLIDATWVITAAHCVDRGTKPGDVDIVLGTNVYKHFGQRLKVKQVIVHENWNSGTMEHDIALLQLQEAATKGKAVEFAASDQGVADGTKLKVSGWGALSEGGMGSEMLMAADIPTVSNETCNTTESYAGRIASGMMCAGLRDGGLDSCQGDSGGPAVATTSSGKKILTGIVSWGSGCARRLKYGVYTNVAVYRQWIDEHMKP